MTRSCFSLHEHIITCLKQALCKCKILWELTIAACQCGLHSVVDMLLIVLKKRQPRKKTALTEEQGEGLAERFPIDNACCKCPNKHTEIHILVQLSKLYMARHGIEIGINVFEAPVTSDFFQIWVAVPQQRYEKPKEIVCTA